MSAREWPLPIDESILYRLTMLKRSIKKAHDDRQYAVRDRLCKEHDAAVMRMWRDTGRHD